MFKKEAKRRVVGIDRDDGTTLKFKRPVSIWQALKALANERRKG